ncbi:MAG: hypothetical protein DDG59_02650 [Anaerolineae bacterium]|jgi:6-phospho-beta-glucosidase|nr:MAG: hypothetical protein DDG59_02650 [Anaerolineae bacterium]
MSRVKLAILGGSALATPVLFDAMGRGGAQASYQVFLHGRDVERLELVYQVSKAIISNYPNLDIQISYTTEIEKALEGADYCLNQIRVGGLEGRAYDETFPRRFGIPGEETVGPGGFSNSLRGIPKVLEIARIMQRVSPQVVVLNLTNPSSIIQYAIRCYTNLEVIGTCDSPVSLMELLAKLLGKAKGELFFSISGMHHFSWVTSILDSDGIERLMEVLDRLEEIPKIGVDPELVRAIGAIPGPYLKYYFHPDRILAETEGRTIRAHQLMKLSDQMLEAYRQWKPGDSTAMLNQRGAVWYDKIVAPTLLALVEKRNQELVLSVDNQDHLPFLPADAIVELPVTIEDGKITKTRPAVLSPFIQALISQNCVYEMLTAQAIAENDRQKALQALMANLMVKSFNQARGILDEVWPLEREPVFRVIEIPTSKENPYGFKVPSLHYGNSLLERYHPQEEEFILITMEELWEKVKDRFSQPPIAVSFVKNLDWYQLEALDRSLPQSSLVVGLGGGVAQDAAKFIAWKRHLPVDLFVSITSVDASVTKSIAARAGGHVTYIGFIVPRNVYMDYELIQSAPPRLNRSGVGDILCAHVALWDWRFAHEQTGEVYDAEAVDQMRYWIDQVSKNADQIRDVTPFGIETIMKAFEGISIICRRFGSSRPQEASDHTFAYNAEFQTGKSFLHGELVALGSWVMANLQENQPEFLEDVFQKCGILWQPRDIGLTRDEFIKVLSTLNWYQTNFGRRYSILNRVQVTPEFIQKIISHLSF